MYRTPIATTRDQNLTTKQSVVGGVKKFFNTVVISCIKFYQIALSPWFGNQCRFYPSCSQYTKEAVVHHGIIKGLLLGAWRLLRCQPLHPGGYDPIPSKKNTNKGSSC